MNLRMIEANRPPITAAARPRGVYGCAIRHWASPALEDAGLAARVLELWSCRRARLPAPRRALERSMYG
jgi:hypothetical protein